MSVQTLTYDAIVVGAGPAGASAAHELAQGGARVLLLEKAHLPRYKACGGGVTARARAVSPLATHATPATQEAQSDSILLAHGRETVTGRVPSPLALVMRDQFDAALVAQAVAAGADVRDRSALTSLDREGTELRVTAGAAVFKARYLIGADGATGMTARLADFAPVADHGAPAIEVELVVPASVQARYAATTLIDVAAVGGGYGWVFAKGEHLSVGVAAFLPSGRRDLRAALPRLLASHPGLGQGRVRLQRGHVIPLAGQRPTRCHGRVILAGDAAGLADPLTGEGISYALASGRRAGVAVLDALREMPGALARYDRFVDRTLGQDMRYARLFAALAYRQPALLLRILAVYPDLQDVAAGAIGGTVTYREFLLRTIADAPSVLRHLAPARARLHHPAQQVTRACRPLTTGASCQAAAAASVSASAVGPTDRSLGPYG